MNEESRSSERDDASIEALMRAVGSRPMPSAQSLADARSAVEAEWRATVAARTRRRRFTTFGRNMHSTSERKLKAHMATAGHASHTLLWSS